MVDHRAARGTVKDRRHSSRPSDRRSAYTASSSANTTVSPSTSGCTATPDCVGSVRSRWSQSGAPDIARSIAQARRAGPVPQPPGDPMLTT
ncbi:MAG TPA: hypothetical protein VNV62_07850 [Trebonia sp.]|nr:hypothetical protein [Trebonia sp.]